MCVKISQFQIKQIINTQQTITHFVISPNYVVQKCKIEEKERFKIPHRAAPQ